MLFYYQLLLIDCKKNENEWYNVAAWAEPSFAKPMSYFFLESLSCNKKDSIGLWSMGLAPELLFAPLDYVLLFTVLVIYFS